MERLKGWQPGEFAGFCTAGEPVATPRPRGSVFVDRKGLRYVKALPQRPQNFVPGAYDVPQALQTTSTERGGRQSSAAEPMGMPHLPQNRMPAG